MLKFVNLSLIFSLLRFLWTTPDEQKPIGYFQDSTIVFDWDHLDGDTIFFQDPESDQAFYQVRSSQGTPLFYAEDLSTEVCFDNKCRPLHATIFWNITGRYLGFKLPEGEFLSRRDHDPLESKDYEKLHKLLADPFLPFKGISFEELIQPQATEDDDVDGISGATSKSIASYVIDGAAYTTYTLWNAIYGARQSIIRSQTESELTPDLLRLILNSASSEDKIWGLKKMAKFEELDTTLENKLLEIIGQDHFFVAYTAIEELLPIHLKSTSLQEGLIEQYKW